MYNQQDDQANIGSVRETFFLNQLNSKYKTNASKEADFLVSTKFTFEIGGKNKNSNQIKG